MFRPVDSQIALGINGSKSIFSLPKIHAKDFLVHFFRVDRHGLQQLPQPEEWFSSKQNLPFLVMESEI